MEEKEPARESVRAFGKIIGLSVVAGVLVAALATPSVVVASVMSDSTIGVFDNLPEYLKVDALAETSNIYAMDSSGQPVLLASVYEENRESVGWESINSHVKDALVSTEDPRFYRHTGVDIASTMRATMGNAVSRNVNSGASTITMQLVKNIFVHRAQNLPTPAEQETAYHEATKTSMDRKLKEMRYAIGLEKQFTKDEILLGYLNIAPFGGSTYGIQSAAKYYYGVDAVDLSLVQAASLIATVNEPNGLRIDRPENIEDNKKRRDNVILPSMLREGTITVAEYEEAVAQPVEPNITPLSTGCSAANPEGAGFFCDYVERSLRNNGAFADATEVTRGKLATGGYDIYTTLDLDLQRAAVQSLNEYVPHESDQLDLGAALVTVEPGTGRVLTMAQNKQFDPAGEDESPTSTAINYSTDYAEGGSSGFAAGSTYKVFTLAEWLNTGHSIDDMVDGNSRTLDLANFQNSCGDLQSGVYTPQNAGRQRPGMMSVRAATASSVNAAYLSMAQQLDQCKIRKTAEAFGVHRADGSPLTSKVSDVLGTNEVAPLTMASAFAAIAAEGRYCAPIVVDRIVDHRDGTELPVPVSECSQAVEPAVAASMVTALTGVVTGGTGNASRPSDGVPIFGKTGTTDNETHTWFVGATTKLATAVWVGNVEGGVSLEKTTIGGRAGDALRHFVWRSYMTEANAKYRGEAFPSSVSRPKAEAPVPAPEGPLPSRPSSSPAPSDSRPHPSNPMPSAPPAVVPPEPEPGPEPSPEPEPEPDPEPGAEGDDPSDVFFAARSVVPRWGSSPARAGVSAPDSEDQSPETLRRSLREPAG